MRTPMTTEALLNDGTIIGARVELRYACLLLADTASPLPLLARFFLLQSVARRNSYGMTKVCLLSSLASVQNYSMLKDRFYPCSPFLSLSLSFSLYLSLFICLSMSLLLFLSVFLSSLGTTLAKQVLLSLPLGVNYLDKDLFRRNTSQERRNT